MLQLRQSGGGQKMKANKDFKSFKRWCEFKGLKPGNATSLQLYMKKNS